MALLAHGTRLGTSPARYYAGVVTIDAGYHHERGNWGRTGATRNWFAGQGTGSDAAKGAWPSGYLPGACWVLPQKAGGLASRGFVDGTGTVAGANLAGGKNASAALEGSGEITSAVGSLILYAIASLSGTGELSDADITALGNIEAALEGVGSVDATGLLAEILEAVATLAGSGSISAAALGAEAGLVASLAGTGSATGEATGIGSLSATVTLAEGGTLTAQQVATAVWEQAIEAGYTAEQIMRLLASVEGGKLSGVDTSTPAFRDLADTKTRVAATTDSTGRTAVTLDLD